jgi:hypothetical protein
MIFPNMNLKVKLELMEICFRRLQEDNAESQTHSPSLLDLNKVTKQFKKDVEYLFQMPDLLEMNARKVKKIDQNAKKISESWRWKIGNQLVTIIERIIRRRSSITAFQEIGEDSDIVISKFRQLKSIKGEPDDFLNPLFRVPPRIFHDKQHKSDGSIAIIILNKDGANHLENLFNSFLKFNTYKNFTITIVDHHSQDPSISIIKKFQEELPIRLHRFDENLTFSYSNNYAVHLTNAEFLLFLNNDILFETDVLGTFINHFRQAPESG